MNHQSTNRPFVFGRLAFAADGSPIKPGNYGSDPYNEKLLSLYDFYSQPGRSMMDMTRHRRSLCGKYAWSIPNDRTLQKIASLNRGVIDPMAGTGYWAMLMAANGIDVVAFDRDDVRIGNNRYHQKAEPWHEVTESDLNDIDWSRYADRVLFLSWPPYAGNAGSDAVMHYLDAGGDTIVYIGEGRGGCTGDSLMFDIFEEYFRKDLSFFGQANVSVWTA